ncbi:MAG: hypothetical protein JNM31_14870 [Flavobacteriales bacterium]|nr:hypothetical protein [Flavobacteriales bacterium]
MRPVVPLFALPLLLGAVLQAEAQTDSVGFIPRKNLIKVGFTSTWVKVATLNYERVLHPDWSVALTVSYMLPVFPSGLFDLNAENIEFNADRKITGMYFTPEVKWFVERSDRRPAPRGLYVGAYLRYSDTRYTASITAERTGPNADGMIQTDLQIDLSELGVGPSLGYQFLAIKDRLAIDAIFFAPRWSLYKLRVQADLQGEGELYDALEEALENILGRQLLNTSIDLSNSGSTTIDRNSLGYRFGIKVGYAF